MSLDTSASNNQTQGKHVVSPRGKRARAVMSNRPARGGPLVAVQHRFLAWDKPQFLVENTSRRPELGDQMPVDPRGDSKQKRDVKLSVTRSAGHRTAARGQCAWPGKSQQRTPTKPDKSSSTAKPVIIGDLWKPMQLRHSTTRDKVCELTDQSSKELMNSGPQNRAITAFEKYSTRQEAQRVLQSSRSTVHQFLRSHQDRLMGTTPIIKSSDTYQMSPRHHGTPTLTVHSNKVAGYQVFGGSIPRTSVYNLNEHIVSDTTDLSALSLGSADHEVKYGGNIATLMTSVSEPINFKQGASRREDLSIKWNGTEVDNKTRVLSSLSNKTREAGMAAADTEAGDSTLSLEGNLIANETTNKPKWQSRDQNMLLPDNDFSVEDKATSPVSSEEEDISRLLRIGAKVPPPAGRSEGSSSSPKSVDEISMVGRENGVTELPQDYPACPMCLAQAAIQRTETEDVNRGDADTVTGKTEQDTAVSQDGVWLLKPIQSNSRQENSDLGANSAEKNDRKDKNTQRKSNSSIRLFPEANQYLSFSEKELIDSSSENEKNSARRPSVKYHSVPVDDLSMLQLNLKPWNRGEKFLDFKIPRSSPEYVSPRRNNGDIAVQGSGVVRSKKMELDRPNPLRPTKWYVKGASPARRQSSSPAAAPTTGRPDALLRSRSSSPKASPATTQRVPLILWRKMQQLETQPHHSNAREEYGARLAGASEAPRGNVAPFPHRQTQRDSCDRRNIGTPQGKTSPLIVHIPTAAFTPEEVDCPPNSPTPEGGHK